jgi:hypothetical protein
MSSLLILGLLGSLLGKLLKALFRVLRRRFPAFDRWPKNISNYIFFLLKLILFLYCALILALLYLTFPIWSYFVYRRDRQAANNCLTSPEQLQRFSESPDVFTRRAAASNPNTPPEALLKLGQRFPKQLLKNPAFNLMLLENPNLLLTMPKETLRRILMLKDIPLGFLEQAAFSPQINVEIARVIAKHPKAPGYVLEKISMFCQDKSVRRSLLKRSDLPPAVLEKLKANDPR